MATALASNLRHSSFADLKIICADGSAWAHRLVLAAVSPVLRCVLVCFKTTYFVMLHMYLLLTYVSTYQYVQLGGQKEYFMFETRNIETC